METRIGAHRVLVEEDVITVYANATWQMQEMREFLQLCERTQARLGRAYAITVVGPGYNLPPDARKYIADWSQHHVLNGNVIVGAPFAMRALIGLAERAARILTARSSGAVFMATEAEARAWVAQHKQQSQSGAAGA